MTTDAIDKATAMTHERRRVHVASAFLLLATVFWGCGFTWAKVAGDTVNHLSGAGTGSFVGPTFLLAWRFIGAGILCLIVIPSARSGWNRRDLSRAIVVGLFLGTGLVLQHLGLDRTSEAVSAFLTNLTVLFVPLIVTIGLRRAPPLVTWIGVLLATSGIWLMTGATPSGFGSGELLGLGCSIAFSFYIISLNLAVKGENVWRITAGQFIIAGVVAAGVCVTSPHGAIAPAAQVRIIADPDVWWRFAILTILTTAVAFSLMNYFQPRLEPTHAALIYLMEPVVAVVFAMLVVGRTLPAIAWTGAALILAANIIVELLSPARGNVVESESDG
jgi:drug/metabolite transporter (DMT)-like permease